MKQRQPLCVLCLLLLFSACDVIDDLTDDDAATPAVADAASPATAVTPDAAIASDAGTPDSSGIVVLPSACGVPAGLASFKPSNLPLAFGLTPGPVITDTPQSISCTLDTDALSWACSGIGGPAGADLRAVFTPVGEVAVIYVESFTLPVGRTLTIVGQRPFVLMAVDKLVISGTLISGGSGTNGYAAGGAPGASTAERKGFGAGGGIPGGATLGGSGGSYCGRGGVATGGTLPTAEPYGTPELVPLVGGSSGGSAWDASGAAGGALQLTAGRSLTISETGIVSAPGYGAGGYAGGSSGGGILLEAPELSMLGTVAANGASGGDSIFGGVRGTVTNTPAASGRDSGRFNAEISPSGTGSAGMQIDGSGGVGSPGAGGGGAGRIRFNAQCPLIVGSNAVITPAKGTACYSEGELAAR